MQTNLDKFKSDLSKLVAEGNKLFTDFAKNKDKSSMFNSGYQKWYTESQEVIRQSLPSRLDEFIQLYYEPKRKTINISTFSIRDWLLGTRASVDEFYGKRAFNDFEAVVMRFQSQIQILESAEARFESSLFDIRQLVQADLFDTELEAAKELNNKGFTRGAGAVAGVVLEKHLSQVCSNHNVKITKKNPAINDLNQHLKDADAIEVKDWRFIQHLADLRNLCDHNKTKEPTKQDVEDLIEGTEKISKTIY